MKHHLLILANPNGRNVTPRKIRELQDVFQWSNGTLQTTVRVTEDLSKLEEVVTEYENREVTILGIVGGDGTVMHTRTLVEERWKYHPSYAFFPLGTMNNIQRAVGLDGKDSSLQLARCIVEAAATDTLGEYAVPIPSLDINGRKGFNIGFGLISKLLWMYNGHSAKHYRELEEALQTSPLFEYQKKYREITGKREQDFFDLLSKERGLWGAAKTVLRLLKARDKSYLLHKELMGEVIFDGEGQDFPQSPLGAYISCYEKVNLGLGRFNPVPSPEANKEKGKFQVVIPYGNPFSIVTQLPKVAAGRRIPNTVYRYISSFDLPGERIAQVDGEIILDKGFKVRYDETRDVIALKNLL